MMNKLKFSKQLKRWGVLSLSLSGAVFLMFAVMFFVTFRIVFSELDNKTIEIENAEFLAVQPLKSSAKRIAIYQNGIKTFTAPCFDEINLCDTRNFLYKTKFSKIIGTQETSSTLIIQKIYFLDNTVYDGVTSNQATELIHEYRNQIINGLTILFISSLIFFVLGIFLSYLGKKSCLRKRQ